MQSDAAAPHTMYSVELAIAVDPAHAGRVTLRVACRGATAVTLALPERADQVEWFEPDAQILRPATPRVMWTAWRTDRDGLATAPHPGSAQRASGHASLSPGDTLRAEVDLGAALDGLYGAGALAQGWCARAWLVGGLHPVPSNIACWPAQPPAA